MNDHDLQRVRRNDALKTDIDLLLSASATRNDRRLLLFVRALQGNTYVKKIYADFMQVTEAINIDPLLNVIEHRTELEEVWCWDDTKHLPGTGDLFLQTVSRNDSIHTLKL